MATAKSATNDASSTTELLWDEGGQISCAEHAPYRGSDRGSWVVGGRHHARGSGRRARGGATAAVRGVPSHRAQRALGGLADVSVKSSGSLPRPRHRGRLMGTDGNAFAVLCHVQRSLRQGGGPCGATRAGSTPPFRTTPTGLDICGTSRTLGDTCAARAR